MSMFLNRKQRPALWLQARQLRPSGPSRKAVSLAPPGGEAAQRDLALGGIVSATMPAPLMWQCASWRSQLALVLIAHCCICAQ